MYSNVSIFVTLILGFFYRICKDFYAVVFIFCKDNFKSFNCVVCYPCGVFWSTTKVFSIPPNVLILAYWWIVRQWKVAEYEQATELLNYEKKKIYHILNFLNEHFSEWKNICEYVYEFWIRSLTFSKNEQMPILQHPPSITAII